MRLTLAHSLGSAIMENLDLRPVLLAWCELQSETLGHKKCARKGVGGMIRKLRGRLDSGAYVMLGHDAERTAAFLERYCRACGKCRRAAEEHRPGV